MKSANPSSEQHWKTLQKKREEYLLLVNKRIYSESLSDMTHEMVERKAQKTEFKEAVISVYSKLAESLMDNQP